MLLVSWILGFCLECSSLCQRCLPLTFHFFKLYPSFKNKLTSYLFYGNFSECHAKKEILESPHPALYTKKKRKGNICLAIRMVHMVYFILQVYFSFIFLEYVIFGASFILTTYSSLYSIKYLNI